MTDEIGPQQLVAAITESFPAAAEEAAAIMDESGYDADWCVLWLEAFAEVTNHRLSDNLTEAQAHLAFMERNISEGSASIKKTIDVSYVASLMFQFSNEEKRAAWTHFPPNIKALYTTMWGEPGKLRPA